MRPRRQNPARACAEPIEAAAAADSLPLHAPSVVRHRAPRAQAHVGSLRSLRFARTGTKLAKLTPPPASRMRARPHAHVAANFANFRGWAVVPARLEMCGRNEFRRAALSRRASKE